MFREQVQSNATARNESSTSSLVIIEFRRKPDRTAAYHQQARVENTFYRYKSTIGGRLQSRDAETQVTEVQVAINVLDRMLELGAPQSEPVLN